MKLHRERGQTAIETLVVFSMLIFLTFAIMNLGVILHARAIATYAAFMGARSFQVLGDQTGAEIYKEMSESGGPVTDFLSEMKESKNPAFFRVSEDIFTCALPWMQVPPGDELTNISNEREKTADERCLAGKRKYETLNIGNPVFTPWSPEDARSNSFDANSSGLEAVKSALSEPGRDPLRFGVLKMTYRTPLLFDFLGLYSSRLHTGEIFVPVLLNPGLRIKLEKADPNSEEEKKFADPASLQN